MTMAERERHEWAVGYYAGLGIWQEGMVLHHNDTTLKYRDPERYHEWRVEDLRPLTVPQHASLHMRQRNPKGRMKSVYHVAAMAAGRRKERMACNVLIHRVVTESGVEGIEAYVYPSCAAAARHICCTRQLVYQTASRTTRNRRACGWYCAYIPKSVSVGEVAGDVLKSLVG